MSFAASNWARAAVTGAPARKVILLLLADVADANGASWPSIGYLATYGEMSKGSVRLRIAELEAAGFLFKIGDCTRADGGTTSNEYVLLLDATARAYAAARGWDGRDITPTLVTPRAKGRSRHAPMDPRQMDLDLGAAAEDGSATAPRCDSPEGPPSTARRGPLRAAGPREPLEDPSGDPPPSPPGQAIGVGVDSAEARQERDERERDLFPAFRKAYPFDVLDRDVPAREAWNRLSSDERAAALTYAPAYAAETEARGRRRLGMDRWLREKGWEPFAREAARREAAAVTSGTVWICEGSEAAAAWARHEGKRKLLVYDSRQQTGRGCYRPTLWPPEIGPPGSGPREVGPAPPPRTALMH